MTEAERELLFYIARALARSANPDLGTGAEIERLLARATDAVAKEKPGAA
jgi:hypothetical protein